MEYAKRTKSIVSGAAALSLDTVELFTEDLTSRRSHLRTLLKLSVAVAAAGTVLHHLEIAPYKMLQQTYRDLEQAYLKLQEKSKAPNLQALSKTFSEPLQILEICIGELTSLQIAMNEYLVCGRSFFNQYSTSGGYKAVFKHFHENKGIEKANYVSDLHPSTARSKNREVQTKRDIGVVRDLVANNGKLFSLNNAVIVWRNCVDTEDALKRLVRYTRSNHSQIM